MGQKEKTATEARKIRILHKALHDIDEIIDFIAIINQQPMNAIKVGNAIWETIDKIEQSPFALENVKKSLLNQKCTVEQYVCHGLLFIGSQPQK